jgi:16S rRNA (guanine527-N7)-methyltransferase
MLPACLSLAEQLAELGIQLPNPVLGDLLRLRDELLRWNRKINLTAVRSPEEAIEKHLVDSLTLVPLLTGTERLLDLGSGGGFPGLPLQIAFPELMVVSVDAVQKKIAFQRHAARLLGLKNFLAWHVRAENLRRQPGFGQGFEVVVSRAFAVLAQFASLAAPCLAPGGRMIAMKGVEGEAELADAAATLANLGLTCRSVDKLTLPASGAARILITLVRD